MHMRRLILFIAAVAVVASSGMAQAPAVTGFSGGTTFGTVDSTNMTVGWSFTPSQNVSVSALGFWEWDTGSTLNGTHQVGLWNSGGTLLSSATVLTNSPLTGSWRYVSITPVTLTAGQTYYIGASIYSPFNEAFTRVPVSGGSVSVSPYIGSVMSAVSGSASGFAFPGTVESLYLARFGPNLLIAPISTPPSVPVSPATLAFIAIGLGVIAFLQLRRRRTERAVNLWN